MSTFKALHSFRALLSRQDVRITWTNTFWLASEKAVRMAVGLFVGLWTARYLGPDSYGQLQYAVAWVGLFGAIAWLGVGDALVRDLIREKQREAELLGAAFAIRFVGSFVAMVLAGSICTLFSPGDETVTTLIWIICLTTPLAEIPGGIWIWFQSRMQMRVPMLMKNLSILLGGALQVSLILVHASLPAFAWALVAEALFLFVAIFGVYKWQGGKVLGWRVQLPTVRQTLVAGFPLILAALVASLNARLDKLMLAWLSGFHDVGVYHAVTRFSAIWWVIPIVLMKSLAPKFIYPENLGPRLQRNVTWISAGLLAMAMIPCLVLPFVGPELIALILGDDYAGGALVLTIHIWVAAFVFLDAPAMQYLLVTNRQHMLIGKSVSALILNILLNAILIPGMGAVGAAFATLAAQVWAGCLFYMIFPKVRDVYAMQRAAVHQLVWGWWHSRGAVS